MGLRAQNYEPKHTSHNGMYVDPISEFMVEAAERYGRIERILKKLSALHQRVLMRWYLPTHVVHDVKAAFGTMACLVPFTELGRTKHVSEWRDLCFRINKGKPVSVKEKALLVRVRAEASKLLKNSLKSYKEAKKAIHP